ncbi:hypothetical protein [Streptococcus hyovaginalis]|uniref:hypothetical protein n=1 Tax=Streptococcus hyovaginalis TaxID=149015 RepID=UPI002A910BDD|nr:hypothetical protein [Streptococcus hyovaginalis]
MLVDELISGTVYVEPLKIYEPILLGDIESWFLFERINPQVWKLDDVVAIEICVETFNKNGLIDRNGVLLTRIDDDTFSVSQQQYRINKRGSLFTWYKIQKMEISL